MRRVGRFSSDTPSSRSSAARVRTTVGKEVSRAFAAAVRLPLSTMRAKVVMARNLSTAELLLHFLEQSITVLGIYSTQGSCDTNARQNPGRITMKTVNT